MSNPNNNYYGGYPQTPSNMNNYGYPQMPNNVNPGNNYNYVQPQTANTPKDEFAIDFIRGYDAAERYWTLPGVTTYLFDLPDKMFYIKSNNQPLRKFSFNEIFLQQNNVVENTSESNNSLQNQITDLKELVLNLASTVQNLSNSPIPPHNDNEYNNRNRKGGNQK